MRIFRFVTDNHLTVRLDLETNDGFCLGRGLDLGTVTKRRTWLSQPPFAGASQAGTMKDVATMTVPLLLPEQASPEDVIELWEALGTELDRPTNNIEFRPDGWPASWFFSTFEADVPPLFRGQDAPAIETLLLDPMPIVLSIPRMPIPTGAGSYI
jgi:hypothetical protein